MKVSELKAQYNVHTDTQLAKLLELPYYVISNAKSGKSRAALDQLVRAAEKRSWPGEEAAVKSIRPIALKRVVVVGAAAAGKADDMELEDEIWVPQSMATDNSRAWITTGDSMMPWLRPGDVVLAEPAKEPRIGYAMLLRGPDGVMVKKVSWTQGGIVCRSLNPSYPDQPFNVEIIGVVTGIYNSVGTSGRMEWDTSGLRPPGF